MKKLNEQLAALVNKYEETKDKELVLQLAIMVRDMCGLGDPIITQRALLLIDEAIEKTG